MVDGELSRYFQAHKDDPQEWEAEGESAKRKPSGLVFSIRLRPAEANWIRSAADREGIRISHLIREALFQYVRGVTSSRRPTISVATPDRGKFVMTNVELAGTPTEAPTPKRELLPEAYTAVA